MVTQVRQQIDETRRDAFAERLFGAALGLADTLTIHIGDRLGLYEHLTGSPVTSADLANAASIDERYAREWLEQQAASGIIVCDDPTATADHRRYSISPEHAEVLVDRESPNWMAPFVRQMAGTASALPRLLEAFRTGGGVPYADFGVDVIEGQGEINRSVLLQLLPREWLPAIPDVHERLTSGNARVADIGCGAAWSSIGIAGAYPGVRVDGFDLDAASIELANGNIVDAGLSDRVTAQLRDAGDPALTGAYDLVIAVEMLHDLSQPVAVLQTMRRLVAEGGAVIVVDERTGEEFTAPADDLDRLFYGWSVLLCLPSARADTPSAATGTVMRPATVARYAEEAGFSRTEVLPIDHPTFRVYRLHA